MDITYTTIAQTEELRRVALFGNFSGTNLGNTATLQAMLFNLRKYNANAQVHCISPPSACDTTEDASCDYVDIDLLPITCFWRIKNAKVRRCLRLSTTLATEVARFRRSVDECRRFDQVVIAGTGTLDDLGQGPFDFPLWLLRWCRAAKRANTRLSFVSVGAGPIKNVLSRQILKRAIAFADYVSYRDRESKDYIESVGCETSNQQVYPDLAFSLPTAEYSKHLPATPPKRIGVGVMAYHGWNAPRSMGQRIYGAYVRKMGEFITWLLEQGYEVRILTGEIGADDQAAQDVRNAVDPRVASLASANLTCEPPESLPDLLRQIALTDAMVATRFHNVLFGILLGRPTISVGFNWKHEALMRDVGLGAYSLDTESFALPDLMERFRDFALATSVLTPRLLKRVSEYRALLDVQYMRLFGRRHSSEPQLTTSHDQVCQRRAGVELCTLLGAAPR